MKSYCFQCKKHVEGKDFKFIKISPKNKLFIYIGTCELCGKKVSKLKKEL